MEPIRVLILTGNLMPMHDYRRVNDVLRVSLEATGRFTVRVSEEAHGVSDETLSHYDLVLLNYDGLDEGVPRGGQGRPAGGMGSGPFRPLGEATLGALERVVAAGHGLVFFHTATCGDAARYPEAYWQLLGAHYRGGQYAGYRDTGYEVRTAPGHPVAEGVSPRWKIADDDFLNAVELLPGTTLLAGIEDPANGREAPVMWCREYGAGRTFATALGHQEDTLRRLDFCRLLIHGCDWAATGRCTVPLPDRDSGDNWMHSWPWYYCPTCGGAEELLVPIGY